MKILGLSCYYHDAAAAIVVEGRVVAAAEEERFTRVKHDNRFPLAAIRYCLERGGMTAAGLDGVVFYEKPITKFHRMVAIARRYPPKDIAAFTERLVRTRHQGGEIERRFRAELRYDGPFWFAEHHASHAASAFFCSPFDSAAIVTLDGVGEFATTTIGHGREHACEILAEMHYPHSLGLFYGAITAFLGFAVNSDEYKVMGLASYGRPRYVQQMERLLHVRADGSFELDLDYFCFHTDDDRMYSDRLIALLGPPHAAGAPAGQREMDIAASAQAALEGAVTGILRQAHALTGENNVCLAGGVALNGVANWRAFRASPFDDLFIQPAAGDAGAAIGAALYAYHQQPGAMNVRETRFSPYLGPEYSDGEIAQALNAYPLSYRKLPEDQLLREVASRISENQIVGWFQGRMEIGPRALGSRSILGNPTNADMKDHINACVKFREEFRPFAPAVLEERADEFFDVDGRPMPYMVLVSDARQGAAERLPAVVHVDNTARVQTVTPSAHPKFHALLEALDESTGVPVVLNTSFNVKGEPIVCTPADAVRCFMNTDIDALAIGNYLVEKAL
jgi:carbamoyltransferase